MVNQLPEEGYYLTSPKIPNYSVWVEIDDKPVQVYSSTQLENGKVQGFIEAIEGKEFKVRCADLRTSTPSDSFTTRVFIDGNRCSSRLINVPKFDYRNNLECSWRYVTWAGKEISTTTQQPFLFGKLQTTDDDDAACTDENVIKNLGTIQVKYQRVKNIHAFQGSAVFESTEAKPIHEQSKKARLSHQAAFGETKSIPARTHSTFDFIDNEENPLQVCEFRYLSRRLLQLEGHVPNSPTPSPAPSASPIPIVARPALSPSPAQSPDSPIAGDTTLAGFGAAGTPMSIRHAEVNEEDRIAQLEAELESLRRQERIATLQRELAALRGGETRQGSSPATSSSSSIRRVKTEVSDGQREAKRVKQEVGEASLSQSASSTQGKRKGKGKGKAETLVLSDSD